MERLLPTVGPRKRSAAGRQTTDTAPLVCRVAAAPDPAYASREPDQAAHLNPSRFRAGGISACCTRRSRTVPPRADRQSAQR
ncbi:hypothetical protein FKK34_21700 [Klebsiella quasipneumoniae]|nr:hypothetical protein [Klebsiella quasipneumoniae]MBK2626923.1 hypothetical protein [Klebsiella quasipneumoniae]MBK3028264.1 hypothetical protein [Klebsiella quasipneumoniae]